MRLTVSLTRDDILLETVWVLLKELASKITVADKGYFVCRLEKDCIHGEMYTKPHLHLEGCLEDKKEMSNLRKGLKCKQGFEYIYPSKFQQARKLPNFD